MPQDLHGLPISTSSAKAAEAFDRAFLSYLKYRVDAPEHLKRTLEADSEFGLAHCLKGYFAMLSYKQANLPIATEAISAARRPGCKLLGSPPTPPLNRRDDLNVILGVRAFKPFAAFW